MKLTRRLCFKSALTILALGTGLAGTFLTRGEPPRRFGLVEDWTTRHVIFSNPGTAVEALAQGRIAQWYRTVNDPRYIMQQLRRNPAPRAGLLSEPFSTPTERVNAPAEELRAVDAQRPPPQAPKPRRDWAVSLGAGTVAQNMFPAKFTFNVNQAPSCTNDFVVYGLNHTGATSGQGNVVAFNQLYSGSPSTSCSPYTVAQPYWAYNATNHSGTVTTSPLLSLDGSKVIYVESSSSASYLHILVWQSADGGTPTSSKVPTKILSTGTSVSSCTAGASCLVTIALGSHSVTYSSPFYDYNGDAVYVGDDNGTLYKIAPVLNSGTPVVITLTVSSGNPLSSPVYDYSSGNIFVGGSTNLYAVNASTMALQSHPLIQVGESGTCNGQSNNVLREAPIVDSSNNWVYEWVTTGADDTHTVVVQAPTTGTNSPTGTNWSATVENIGEGDSSCNSSGTFPTSSPAFDNNYYGASVTTGHLWICGREASGSQPELWEIPTSGTGGALGSPSAKGTSALNAVTHAVCSPFTEFYNTSNSTDYLFTGEGLSGSGGFGSLYGFTISGTTVTAISGSPLTYPTAAGGTSGIVIDNVGTANQESSIYFSTLATGSSPCGSGNFCAVKLTQAGLN